MQSAKGFKLNRNYLTAGILLAVSLGLLVWLDLAFIIPLKTLDIPNYDNDLSVFWVGTRTVWQGGNPYDHAPGSVFNQIATQAGGEADIFFSPFFFTLIFSPFAIFPLKVAALLWLLMIQVLLIFSVVLIIRLLGFKLTGRTLLIGVLFAVFWRYAFQVMILNNLSIPILFLVLLTYYLNSRGRFFTAGIVAAFLLLKPQLVFLTLPLLLVMPSQVAGQAASWFNRNTLRRWYGFGATSLVFAVYSFAVFPSWISGWLMQAGSRVTPTFDSEMTSVRSIIALLIKDSQLVALIYYIVAAIGCVLVFIFWWLNRNNATDFIFVFGVVLCANIFLAPYVRSYDFVLILLPLIGGYLLIRQAETAPNGQPEISLKWLWLLLMILHWPLHLLSVTTTFAWENIPTLTVLGLFLLAWQKSQKLPSNNIA